MKVRIASFLQPVHIISSIVILSLLYVSSIPALAYNTHSVDLERDSSQYLSVGDNAALSITGDFTLETWVKFESIPTGLSSLVSKLNSNGTNGYILYYQQSDGKLHLWVNGASVDTDLGVSWSPSTATWYHVAVTYNQSNGNVKFYINGAQQGSTLSYGTGGPGDGASSFYVGADYDGGRTFDGLVDDVRVWNIERTAQQISDDKGTELNGNETGLAGYWKLNNSLGDSTANGNTLTNNGSSVFSSDSAFGFTEDLSNRKNSNESVTSSTSLQDDDELKLSLSGGKTYVIDGVLFASSTSATPDIVIAFTGQTGSVIRVGYTNDVNEMVINSGEQSNRISLPANTPTSVHIKGTIVTTNSGDFKLKWAQATSNANPTTLMEGSYIRAQEI